MPYYGPHHMRAYERAGAYVAGGLAAVPGIAYRGLQGIYAVSDAYDWATKRKKPPPQKWTLSNKGVRTKSSDGDTPKTPTKSRKRPAQDLTPESPMPKKQKKSYGKKPYKKRTGKAVYKKAKKYTGRTGGFQPKKMKYEYGESRFNMKPVMISYKKPRYYNTLWARSWVITKGWFQRSLKSEVNKQATYNGFTILNFTEMDEIYLRGSQFWNTSLVNNREQDSIGTNWVQSKKIYVDNVRLVHTFENCGPQAAEVIIRFCKSKWNPNVNNPKAQFEFANANSGDLTIIDELMTATQPGMRPQLVPQFNQHFNVVSSRKVILEPGEQRRLVFIYAPHKIYDLTIEKYYMDRIFPLYTVRGCPGSNGTSGYANANIDAVTPAKVNVSEEVTYRGKLVEFTGPIRRVMANYPAPTTRAIGTGQSRIITGGGNVIDANADASYA